MTPTTHEFPQPLRVEDNCDGTVTLIEPFLVQAPSARFLVTAGIVTDFASIPQVLRGLLPPDGVHYGRAAVAHDYLYQTGGNGGQLTREQCDRVLVELMQALGCGLAEREEFYLAVRLGGAGHWKPAPAPAPTLPAA